MSSESGYQLEIAHHEAFEYPIHMLVAPADLSNHIITSKAPLELLKFGLSSTLRQNFDYSHKLTTHGTKTK